LVSELVSSHRVSADGVQKRTRCTEHFATRLFNELWF
jgi:hypothetical protein